MAIFCSAVVTAAAGALRLTTTSARDQNSLYPPPTRSFSPGAPCHACDRARFADFPRHFRHRGDEAGLLRRDPNRLLSADRSGGGARTGALWYFQAKDGIRDRAA